MARISKALQNSHRLTLALIPENVIKSLDDAELADRCLEAEALARRAHEASDPVLRVGYKKVAQAMLQARPRAEVAREHGQLIAKAAFAPPAQAAALRRKAAELLEENPLTPRHTARAPVAKARAGRGLPVAVYDQRRRLAGLVDPARIVQRVTKAAKADADPVPVFDQAGNLVGVVADPEDITPVSRVAGGAKAAGPEPAASAAPSTEDDAVDAAVAKAMRHLGQAGQVRRQAPASRTRPAPVQAPRRRTGR